MSKKVKSRNPLKGTRNYVALDSLTRKSGVIGATKYGKKDRQKNKKEERS